MKDEQITMTELGERWNMTRQGAAKLARTAPNFPETLKQGRSVTVSWKAAEKWRKARLKACIERKRDRQKYQEHRIAAGKLYRLAQLLFGADAYLVTQNAHSVQDCYDLARSWGADLDEN